MTPPNQTALNFDGGGKRSRATAAYYLTNQMNLKEILSCGLIKPQEGYPPEKHYQDLLHLTPGRLPLLMDKVPAAALELVCQEEDFLFPVLLRLEPAELAEYPCLAMSGPSAPVPTRVGEAMEAGAEQVVLEGVLPTSLVSDVYFGNPANKKSFQKEVKRAANVDLAWIKERQKKGLFGGKRPVHLEQLSELPLVGGARGWRDFLETEARGGVLAQLLLGCPPEQGWKAVVDASLGLGTSPAARSDLPAWAGEVLPAWLHGECLPPGAGGEGRVLWALLNKLGRKRGRAEPPARGLIKTLRETAAELDEPLRERLQLRADQLEDLTGVGDLSHDEFFGQTRAVLGGLLLFLLCKDSRTLASDRALAWEAYDLAPLVARLLCGAWEGWTQLPANLRGEAKVGRMVTDAMARWHNSRVSGRPAAPEPPAQAPEASPHTVSPADQFSEEAWRLEQVQQAARTLCRRMGWDCLRTVIPLPPGSYELGVKPDGAHLVVAGEVKVEVEVIRERFVELLGQASLPPDAEADLLEQLDKGSHR